MNSGFAGLFSYLFRWIRIQQPGRLFLQGQPMCVCCRASYFTTFLQSPHADAFPLLLLQPVSEATRQDNTEAPRTTTGEVTPPLPVTASARTPPVVEAEDTAEDVIVSYVKLQPSARACLTWPASITLAGSDSYGSSGRGNNSDSYGSSNSDSYGSSGRNDNSSGNYGSSASGGRGDDFGSNNASAGSGGIGRSAGGAVGNEYDDCESDTVAVNLHGLADSRMGRREADFEDTSGVFFYSQCQLRWKQPGWIVRQR